MCGDSDSANASKADPQDCPKDSRELFGEHPGYFLISSWDLPASLSGSFTRICRALPGNYPGNLREYSPGDCREITIKIQDEGSAARFDQDATSSFARLAQDSPRQSPNHPPRALPRFPKHCERLPQGLPEELTKIPQAPCKISHGVPNIIVKYCPSHLGMKIRFERLPKECPKDSRELFGELPG